MGSNLIQAAADGNLEALRLSIESASELERSDALILSSAANNTDAVDILLKSGVSPSSRGSNGTTPLHAAAITAARDCIGLLLKNGADINLADEPGDTALAVAARGGVEICSVFLAAIPSAQIPLAITATVAAFQNQLDSLSSTTTSMESLQITNDRLRAEIAELRSKLEHPVLVHERPAPQKNDPSYFPEDTNSEPLATSDKDDLIAQLCSQVSALRSELTMRGLRQPVPYNPAVPADVARYVGLPLESPMKALHSLQHIYSFAAAGPVQQSDTPSLKPPIAYETGDAPTLAQLAASSLSMSVTDGHSVQKAEDVDSLTLSPAMESSTVSPRFDISHSSLFSYSQVDDLNSTPADSSTLDDRLGSIKRFVQDRLRKVRDHSPHEHFSTVSILPSSSSVVYTGGETVLSRKSSKTSVGSESRSSQRPVKSDRRFTRPSYLHFMDSIPLLQRKPEKL